VEDATSIVRAGFQICVGCYFYRTSWISKYQHDRSLIFIYSAAFVQQSLLKVKAGQLDRTMKTRSLRRIQMHA
jgi:hypothetical protein